MVLRQRQEEVRQCHQLRLLCRRHVRLTITVLSRSEIGIDAQSLLTLHLADLLSFQAEGNRRGTMRRVVRTTGSDDFVDPAVSVATLKWECQCCVMRQLYT